MRARNSFEKKKERRYLMLSFLKREKEIILYAPVDGESISLDAVEDKMFAEKMMGDGIAFSYNGNTVCAPCDGTIIMIASTLHAFGIKAENGAEILIHIGMDTVALEGKGFKKLVDVNKKVKKGTPIIALDRTVFTSMGMDMTTPMVITNGDEYSFTISDPKKGLKCGEDVVIRFN